MTASLHGQRIAVYARFSTDKQNAASIDAQVSKVRSFVEGRGGCLGATYSDEAVSGAVRKRPGLLDLVRAIEAGKVDVLVVEDLGRISRDVEDLAWFRKRCAYHGVRLIAIDDGVDTSSEGAELMGDVLSSFKSLYRREIAAKTLRGMEERARQGFASGAVAYGFRLVRVDYQGGEASKIEIHEEHARVVRDIFDGYATGGLSLEGIAAALNERGVPPPRATKPRKREAWGVSTVRTILHNEAYIGRWSFGRTKWQRDPDTRRRRPRERDEALVVVDRPELAIVDGATWDAVRARLEETRFTFTKSGRRVPVRQARGSYPLSGLVFCGHCGQRMTISGGEEGRRYYRCTGARVGACEQRRSVRESILRERLIAAIRERFGSSEGVALIEQLIAEELASESESDTRRRDLVARLEQTEARIRRLVLAVADGNAPAVVLTTIGDLERQRDRDRAELERLAEVATAPLDAPTARDVLDGLEVALEGPAASVRAALASMLEGGRIDIVREEDGAIYARGGVLPSMFLGCERRNIAGAVNAPSLTPVLGLRVQLVA